jgi:hypothetical protein
MPQRGTVLVAVDESGGKDDFGGRLVEIREGEEPRWHARGLVTASLPLGRDDGTVFLERGRPGTGEAWGEKSPNGAVLRVDDLHVDALTLATGALRTVYKLRGYATHLAGVVQDSLVLYTVRPEGAEIVVVDVVHGTSRSLAQVPPFARDFSFDQRQKLLVFSNRHATDPRLWEVCRLDLASGTLEHLLRTPGDAPAPFLSRNGHILFGEAGRTGKLVDWFGGERHHRVDPGLGPGFVYVPAEDGSALWVAVMAPNHDEADGMALVHLASGRRIPVQGVKPPWTVLGFGGGRVLR